MSINCVSSYFWEKPFSIDFADKKFGYCALAVFTKKGVFQRTYMIPVGARSKVTARKYPYRGADFRWKNEKIYNMCVDGDCSFDSERAIMHYYNKTDEGFSKKKVYAIYFNLYKVFYYQNFSDCINYVHQIYGEEAELSSEDIENICQDIQNRVTMSDLLNLTGSFNLYSFPPQINSSNIESAKNIYALFDIYNNGVQNTVLIKNKQILCDMHGIKAGEFDLPYLAAFTHNVLSIASKTDLVSNWFVSGVKEYATLLVNHYILNIKCYYHFFMDTVLSKSNDETLKSGLCNLISEFSQKRIEIKFHNERKLCESFASGLKLLAVINASHKILNHTNAVYYNPLMRMEYHFDPRRTNDFTNIHNIMTDYFVPGLKQDIKDRILDKYVVPSNEAFRGSPQPVIFPESTTLPLMYELTPPSKTNTIARNFLTAINDLRYFISNSHPIFPIYDGKTCAFISFDNMGINEIYIIGGE